MNSNISILWPWNDSDLGKECLGIERHRHRTPILVGLSCYLLKPFICERGTRCYLDNNYAMTIDEYVFV